MFNLCCLTWGVTRYRTIWRTYKTFDNAVRGAERLLTQGKKQIMISENSLGDKGTAPQIWAYDETGLHKLQLVEQTSA